MSLHIILTKRLFTPMFSASTVLFDQCSALFVLNVHQIVARFCTFRGYELAFLLFGVKEATQVEDDRQKEHETGHCNDGDRLFPGERAIEILAPQSAGHIHCILNIYAKREVLFHLAVQLTEPAVVSFALFTQFRKVS